MAGELTMDRAYFDDVYAASDDPWHFRDSWYERRKYALTLAALPKERYHRAFEPGCSIGELSHGLAARCDELVAMELVPAVAEIARSRVAGFPGASVRAGAIPEDWPDGTFDLVVLSEIAYYLTRDGLARVLDRLRHCLRPGGTVVAVHYLLETNYPLTGAEAGRQLREARWLRTEASYVERSFELIVLRS